MSSILPGLGPLTGALSPVESGSFTPSTATDLPAEESVYGPATIVEISAEAQRLAELMGEDTDGALLLNAALRAEAEQSLEAEGAMPGEEAEEAEEAESSGADGSLELSEEEQEEVNALQRRDAEVRAHEAAHQAAGGGLTGGASFSYETGPDGQRYATGGEVSIRMGKGRTPAETIQKAQTIRAAAMAPAQPSSQDRAVAAAASRMESQARQQQAAEQAAELEATMHPAEEEDALEASSTTESG